MRARMSAALVLLCWVAGGCESTLVGEPIDTESHRFELYSWLSSGREYHAVNVLYDLLRQRDPGIYIVGTGDTSVFRFQAGAGAELSRRIAEGNPPDSFQTIGGADLFSYVEMG